MTQHQLRMQAGAIAARAKALIPMNCTAVVHLVGKTSATITVKSVRDDFVLELRLVDNTGGGVHLSLVHKRGEQSEPSLQVLREYDGLVLSGWR